MSAVRLQKFLADAGLASRRAGEQLILSGQVAVNGGIVSTLGARVNPERDRVTVNGAPLKAKRKLYVAVNKPRGCICSRRDPQRRRTVGDLLPREWSNLYPVGRLDYDSEGLIFLTNDGEFCLKLTHPRYGVRKKYLVTVKGRVGPEILARLARGVYHDGERLKAGKVRLLSPADSRTLVEVELTEGKNREVRRLFESQGLTVAQLRRTQIGRIKLGDLPPGKWRALTAPEIAILLSENIRPVKSASQRH